MKLQVLIVLFTVFILTSAAAGQKAQEAEEALEEAENIIEEMNKSEIPTQRASDLYEQANSSYQTQLERNRSGKETDYTTVSNTVDQIKELRTEAFRVKDRLEILRSRIDELDEEENLNLSEAKNQLEDAETEFQDERFERSQEHIDNAYQEISEAQSAVTQAQAFTSATQDRFTSFIQENWEKLVAALTVLSLSGFLGLKEYRIHSLKKKKRELKQKREVLQDLIAEAQNDYFQKNEMAESTYNTRTEKYGEMIRDINRQLPLIDEELEKRWSASQKIKQKVSDTEEGGQEA